MNKVKKILKNNKYTVIGLIIFIVLVVIGYGAYRFFFPNIGTPVYGNRLDDIKEHEITKDDCSKVISKLEENEAVVEATTDIEGRVFNVIITVKETTKLDDAKKLTTIIIENIKTDQKEYFDIQVFLKNEKDEVEGYPTIGYLGKTETEFSYSTASLKQEEE